MPKTTVAGGASHAGYVDVSPADVDEPEWVAGAAAVFAGVETSEVEATSAETATPAAVETPEAEAAETAPVKPSPRPRKR